MTGANPSAEEQEESLEDTVEKVNNVVASGRLQTTSFDKKSYISHIKVCILTWGYRGQLYSYINLGLHESGQEPPQ